VRLWFDMPLVLSLTKGHHERIQGFQKFPCHWAKWVLLAAASECYEASADPVLFPNRHAAIDPMLCSNNFEFLSLSTRKLAAG